jgi:hypothetical protein
MAFPKVFPDRVPGLTATFPPDAHALVMSALLLADQALPAGVRAAQDCARLSLGVFVVLMVLLGVLSFRVTRRPPPSGR